MFLDKTPRGEQWNKEISKLESHKWQSRLLPYADEIAGLISACHIVAIESHNKNSKEVAVIGDNARAEMFRRLVPCWGLSIVDDKDAPIIVLAGKARDYKPLFHPGLIMIYDLMSGVITSEIAKILFVKGVKVVRLDGRAALISEVISLFDAKELADEISGRANINNVPVVAGGFWGNLGDVVVNSIKTPTQIIGIADGEGAIKLELDENDMHKIELVKIALRARLLGAKNI